MNMFIKDLKNYNIEKDVAAEQENLATQSSAQIHPEESSQQVETPNIQQNFIKRKHPFRLILMVVILMALLSFSYFLFSNKKNTAKNEINLESADQISILNDISQAEPEGDDLQALNSKIPSTGINVFDKIILAAKETDNFSFQEKIDDAITVSPKETREISVSNTKNYFKEARTTSSSDPYSKDLGYIWMDRVDKKINSINYNGLTVYQYTLNEDGSLKSVTPEPEINTLGRDFIFYIASGSKNKYLATLEIGDIILYAKSLGLDTNFSKIDREVIIDNKKCQIFANLDKTVLISIWPDYGFVMKVESSFLNKEKSGVEINMLRDADMVTSQEELQNLEEKNFEVVKKKFLEAMDDIK